MRVNATDEYLSHKAIDGCSYLEDCDRFYCKSHRLLWVSCETAIKTKDGAGQIWYAQSDCPVCMSESRIGRAYAA